MNHTDPWILLGDFNSILFSDDRQGGNSPSLAEIEDIQSCTTTLGLEDAYSIGNLFTWTNGNVWSRIDRVLVNSEWNQQRLHCLVEALPFCSQSDHSILLVSLTPQTQALNRPFKFHNMWMLHPTFHSIMREAWCTPLNGTIQLTLCMKLNNLKLPLKALNRQEFSHIFERARRAKAAYSKIQTQLMLNPSFPILKVQAKEHRATANFLLAAERVFLQQKTKNAHVMLADRNTAYFHSLLKKRNVGYSIAAIRKSDGTLTKSQDEVVNEFVDFYKNLLGVDAQVIPISTDIMKEGPVLSLEDKALLSAPIDDLEIKDTLFHIGDEKARGPDGFSAAFFKQIWDFIKVVFLAAVHKFFRSGSLLKQLNHAAITLIPKAKHDPNAGDFRPIYCCNVIYKTISKIIAKRLVSIIPELVDHAQTAFLEDRIMTDNILLAQQLIRRYGRKTSSPICMLMVDLKKAYDTLSWSFMINLLKDFGFPQCMVSWIRECVTTAYSSIFLNGKMHGYFPNKRGLRQGDPLSPYIFVLAMKYLSRALKINTTNHDFNYHPKCGKIKLTHLAFAYDIMLSSRGNSKSVSILYHALLQFGMTSGLELNLHKSKLFAVGISENDLETLKQITGFTIGEFPVSYLGSSLVCSKLKTSHFYPLIERIKSYIKAWSIHTLSYSGRVELIKSVIQGVEVFWFQNFPLSWTIIDWINKICRSFLWAGSKPKVAWKDICSPKEEGGLGLRDGKIWNKAILFKVLWDIHANKNTLWVKWVHSVYLNGTDVWQ